MRQRQTLLDWAMNRQTESTKDYPLVQECLFLHKPQKERGQNVSNRSIDQNKETGHKR